MGNRRPERDMVEQALKKNYRRKAHEIASEVGLIEAIGYDKAVDYVRRVKKSMKASGLISGTIASDEDRLQDITILFELRKGNPKAVRMMLMLNCYYRLRSKDDSIHMGAIDDTYAKNAALDEPITMAEAIRSCEIALAQYMQSIDEDNIQKAKRRGFPGAGLNYSDQRFIEVLQITEDELTHMVSISNS